MSHSIRFFDAQFGRQVAASEYALNDFELAVLPHLSGDVLDVGCGLGNLSLAAAERGCRVTALDASPTAIADLGRRAEFAGTHVHASAIDLRGYRPHRRYDGVVCIGLAMFFRCSEGRELLVALRDAVQEGGVLALNVLVEGTTFLDMFEPDEFCLFDEGELDRLCEGWTVLHAATRGYPAPRDTVKRFRTVVARRRSSP